MRFRGLVVLLIGVALLAAACGGSSKKAASTTPTTSSTTTPQQASSGGCTHTRPPIVKTNRTFLKPGRVLAPGAKAAIVMVTSCGKITIQLVRDKKNPIPNSIAFLVTKRFYDGLAIFRAVPGFVLQGGDPNNNGTGDAGYNVIGQVPMGYAYQLGDVAMAKTSDAVSGTAGSQFFLISGAQGEQLGTQYGLLGHAADKASLATIARLNRFATDSQKPSKPLWIWTAKLVRE
jgi:cyclophilin family peptidyl-prolyl cis-trans isomerase